LKDLDRFVRFLAEGDLKQNTRTSKYLTNFNKRKPNRLNQRSRMCSIRNLTKLFAERGKKGSRQTIKPK